MANKDVEKIQIQEFNMNEIMPDSTILCLGQRRSGKCFAKNTKILMSNGTLKNVQDIHCGDTVMGDDNNPRTVLDSVHGNSDMYTVYHIADNRYYSVNGDHLLCLLYCREPVEELDRYIVYSFDTKLLIETQEYFPFNSTNKARVYALALEHYKCVMNCVCIISVEQFMLLPKEVSKYLYGYSQAVDYHISESDAQLQYPLLSAQMYGNILVSMNYITRGHYSKSAKLPLKHSKIPEVYYSLPLSMRFQFIDELLGEDCAFTVHSSNILCYTRLLWSIGCRFNILKFKSEDGSRYAEINVHCDDYNTQKEINSHNLQSSACMHEIAKIPFQIYVKPIGKCDYYGFSVDGNHRFLLGNYIVVHNSWVIRDIMYHCQKIPQGIVFSGTERASPFFGDFIPDTFIYDEYKNEVVEKVLKRQEAKIEYAKKKYNSRDGKVPENNMFIIMDDLMDKNNIWKTSDTLRTIFFNGRHYNIFFIIALQYLKSITPDMRSNFDYVFMFNTVGLEMRRKIYNDYGAVIKSFEHFCNILDECTVDHSCLVIKTIGTGIKDQVFWYKAKLRENFKVGSSSIWKYHLSNYDNRYKLRENKEFDKIEEIKKKFSNTKKLKVLISRKKNEIIKYRPE